MEFFTRNTSSLLFVPASLTSDFRFLLTSTMKSVDKGKSRIKKFNKIKNFVWNRQLVFRKMLSTEGGVRKLERKRKLLAHITLS